MNQGPTADRIPWVLRRYLPSIDVWLRATWLDAVLLAMPTKEQAPRCLAMQACVRVRIAYVRRRTAHLRAHLDGTPSVHVVVASDE